MFCTYVKSSKRCSSCWSEFASKRSPSPEKIQRARGKSAAALGLYWSLLWFMDFAAFQYLKGLVKKVERDFSQGYILAGKVGMVLN